MIAKYQDFLIKKKDFDKAIKIPNVINHKIIYYR